MGVKSGKSPPISFTLFNSCAPTLRHPEGNWVPRKCSRLFSVCPGQKPGEGSVEWLRLDFSV